MSLWSDIELARDPEDGWCSPEKANALAALVVGLRPHTIVEIGVWRGASAIPMALALKSNGDGTLVAIDPWDRHASVTGQEEQNAAWWASVDHERARLHFLERIDRWSLHSYCQVVQASSDDARVPDVIWMLHIDGNHGPQAIADVKRFTPQIPIGGILVIDDVHWTGGAVIRAVDLAQNLGFSMMYMIGNCAFLQRRS